MGRWSDDKLHGVFFLERDQGYVVEWGAGAGAGAGEGVEERVCGFFGDTREIDVYTQ